MTTRRYWCRGMAPPQTAVGRSACPTSLPARRARWPRRSYSLGVSRTGWPWRVRAAQGLGLDRIAGQLRPLQRHGPLFQQGQGQPFLVRAGSEGVRLDPGNPGPGADPLQGADRA